jgi:hypothetical protein
MSGRYDTISSYVHSRYSFLFASPIGGSILWIFSPLLDSFVAGIEKITFFYFMCRKSPHDFFWMDCTEDLDKLICPTRAMAAILNQLLFFRPFSSCR